MTTTLMKCYNDKNNQLLHTPPNVKEMGITATEELGRQQYLLCHLLNYS